MKRGIEITWAYDFTGRMYLKISKARGKLTLEEIQDLLLYENNQKLCGHYAILLNCSEETIGGNGVYLEKDSKGDSVGLYQIEQEGTCPLCGEHTPPFEYCPHCGMPWKDGDTDIEKTLRLMRKETIRMVSESSEWDSKMTWYWSYIGALDLAKDLKFITEDRRQELQLESREWKPKH